MLPLSLVDWHSEQGKFDDGPYLTTILGLDWAVAKALAIRPFEDPMAFDTTANLIAKLERKLNIKLDNARARLDECRKYDRPFSFTEKPDDELAMISAGFRARWARPLLHLISRFQPYLDLIETRGNLETLSPEFANWFALKQSASNAGGGKAAHLLEEIERFLANRDPDPIAVEDLRKALDSFDSLKQDRELAFTVVFQRALILAFLQLTKVSEGMVNSLSSTTEVDLEDCLDAESSDEGDVNGEASECDAHEQERAEELIEALNHIVAHEPDFLLKTFEFPWHDARNARDRFWLCTFTRPEGQIDFSQSALVRASDILLLAGLFWLYRQHEGLGRRDFQVLMDRADEAKNGIDLKLQLCLSRMWSASHSIAERILSSRDQDTGDDDLRWREIEGRAAWLWSLITR